MERYRSGHNGADSKFLEAPAVSSAENVHRAGLCAGSDFTISYRSCVFFLHSSGAGITLEIYGELSERSKVRHSKFLEAPVVSSAENVRRAGLCAGSDFTISYRSCVFFLHSSGARITLEVYGELSERSKVRHSKCRVPKRNLGFESLTLRQKPSHIKAFAHMTGLFFSLKVTSAYMIFGKNSGVPAGLPCVRQSQDIVHYICRGDLGLVIQMAVNIRRRANIAVTQPLLDLLQRHIVRQKQ